MNKEEEKRNENKADDFEEIFNNFIGKPNIELTDEMKKEIDEFVRNITTEHDDGETMIYYNSDGSRGYWVYNKLDDQKEMAVNYIKSYQSYEYIELILQEFEKIEKESDVKAVEYLEKIDELVIKYIEEMK